MKHEWPLYHKIVKLLLIYLTVNTTVDAYAFINDIGVSSQGYQLAYDILPPKAWGLILAFSVAAAILALFGNGRRRNDFARTAFIVRAFVDIFFGLAILHATIIGATSAITGPGKWWRGPITAIAVLMLPSPGQNTAPSRTRENREDNAA